MKKEMSSFDVSSLVTEMAALEDAHLDKTYQWDNNVLFRINAKGSGKVFCGLDEYGSPIYK